MHVGVKTVQDTNKVVDQSLGCHSRGDSVNDAMRTVTTFAVFRLVTFLSGFQNGFRSIPHKVFLLIPASNTNSKHGWAVRFRY